MSDASTRASRRARSCFRRSASGSPGGMPAEGLNGDTAGAGAANAGAGGGGATAGPGEPNEKRSTSVGAIGVLGSSVLGGSNGFCSAVEPNGASGDAGGEENGFDLSNAGSGGAGGAGCGVGGIKGSSVGAAAGGRSTENTSEHLRQRTRAPCTGILSSAMV